MTASRRLAGTVLVLLLAAFALWLASRLVWLRASYLGPLRGLVQVPVTGAQLHPQLGALAVTAVASVVALIASTGWLRRSVGMATALASVWVLWLGVGWFAGAIDSAPVAGAIDSAPVAGAIPAGAIPVGPPVRTGSALLVVLAGALLGLAALAMIWWATAMPTMGGRYAAPSAARASPGRDRDWWHALDVGDDPTASGPGADPGPRP